MLPYPALSAARLMRQALIQHGITVGGIAATGKAPFGAPELSSVYSKPLWRILRTMDRFSDNFMAEMVIKAVGALGDGAGSTAAGLRSPAAVLQQTIGADANDAAPRRRLRALSANRATSSALAELLARTANDPTLGPALRQALAQAGVNGTLERSPRRRRARAREDRDARRRLVALGLRHDAARHALRLLDPDERALRSATGRRTRPRTRSPASLAAQP